MNKLKPIKLILRTLAVRKKEKERKRKKVSNKVRHLNEIDEKYNESFMMII